MDEDDKQVLLLMAELLRSGHAPPPEPDPEPLDEIETAGGLFA